MGRSPEISRIKGVSGVRRVNGRLMSSALSRRPSSKSVMSWGHRASHRVAGKRGNRRKTREEQDLRMEGYENLRMEGWKDLRMEGYENGRRVGYENGRMEGYANGRMEGHANGRICGGRWQMADGR